MASDRYKKRPRGYERGGRVVADDDGTLTMRPPEDEPEIRSMDIISEPPPDHVTLSPEPPPAKSAETADISEPSPFVAILAAQARAEELQRKAAFEASFAGQIAALAATDPFRHRAAMFHHQAALAEGIADNSPEMRDYILGGIQREVQEQHKLAVQNLQTRGPALMPREPMAKMPDNSVVLPEPTIISSNRTNNPEPPAPRKSSIPFTAPPSRDVPSMGGGKRQRDRGMTLSPEERLIARNAIVDRPDMPPMSNAEKELLYARNKKRLLEMRASGEYRQTTEQGGG